MHILEKKKDLISIPIFYLRTPEKEKKFRLKASRKKEIMKD